MSMNPYIMISSSMLRVDTSQVDEKRRTIIEDFEQKNTYIYDIIKEQGTIDFNDTQSAIFYAQIPGAETEISKTIRLVLWTSLKQ